MSKRVVAYFVLFAAVIAVIAFSFWMTQQLRIDSCLDRGGRWNYKNGNCEGI